MQWCGVCVYGCGMSVSNVSVVWVGEGECVCMFVWYRCMWVWIWYGCMSGVGVV